MTPMLVMVFDNTWGYHLERITNFKDYVMEHNPGCERPALMVKYIGTRPYMIYYDPDGENHSTYLVGVCPETNERIHGSAVIIRFDPNTMALERFEKEDYERIADRIRIHRRRHGGRPYPCFEYHDSCWY